jgi:hypothetical protein
MATTRPSRSILFIAVLLLAGRAGRLYVVVALLPVRIVQPIYGRCDAPTIRVLEGPITKVNRGNRQLLDANYWKLIERTYGRRRLQSGTARSRRADERVRRSLRRDGSSGIHAAPTAHEFVQLDALRRVKTDAGLEMQPVEPIWRQSEQMSLPADTSCGK